MTKFRCTTGIGVVIGLCGIWLAAFLVRDVEMPFRLDSETASAGVLMSGGGMILFVSAGFLLLSFTSSKVRVDRKGHRSVRAPFTVIFMCVLSAALSVATAAFATYLTIFDDTGGGGGGGSLTLLALCTVPLAAAVLGTGISAACFHAWYPSITFDGNTLVVRSIGSKRSFSPVTGVTLEASNVAGVFIRGKLPQSVKYGLVPTAVRLFTPNRPRSERDSTVTTIRIKQHELDSLVSGPEARQKGPH